MALGGLPSRGPPGSSAGGRQEGEYHPDRSSRLQDASPVSHNAQKPSQRRQDRADPAA